MALITILPGEHFEHKHAVVSTSEIKQGVAEVTVGTTQRIMREGESMMVPENCSHSFKNIGDVPLVVGCGYQK